MAPTPIKSYQVTYSGNNFSPRIGLLNAGKYIGQLIFMPDGTALPPDYLSGTQANIYYHLENYAHCIDLLRNEKPVYLLYGGSGDGFENGIITGDEAVGEGEKK